MSDTTGGFFEAMRSQIAATPLSGPQRSRPTARKPFSAAGAFVRRRSGAAVAAVAVVVAVLVSLAAGPPPAYALTVNANGSVTVTFYDLAAAIPQVNAKFRQLGIHATVIPIRGDCHSVGGPPGQHAAPNAVAAPGSMSESFTYNRRDRRPAPKGFRYVLAAKQLKDGKIEMWIGAVRPPLPACFAGASQH